jgi:hypothetical protein
MKHITVARYISKWMLRHKKMGNFIELYYHYSIEMDQAEVAMLSHSNKLKQFINAKPHHHNEMRPSAMLYRGWGQFNKYANFKGIRRKTGSQTMFGSESRFASDGDSELNQGVKSLLFRSYSQD